MKRPAALTIAGSDSGGGAGIQMDLRVMTVLGCWATTAVTCVTAQNLEGVVSVAPVPPETIRAQVRAAREGFPVRAVKTGMLYSREIVEAVAEVAGGHGFPPLVVDPVMVATSGARLLQEDAVHAYRDRLIPRATVVTPNLDEAEVLGAPPVRRAEEMETTARDLSRDLGVSVLLKGGHLPGDPVDVLAHEGGLHRWNAVRVKGVNAHGSGCALSAAVAAGLAHGRDLVQACADAHAFLAGGFARPQRLVSGTLLLGVEPPRGATPELEGD